MATDLDKMSEAELEALLAETEKAEQGQTPAQPEQTAAPVAEPFTMPQSLNQQVISPERAGLALGSGVLSIPKLAADITNLGPNPLSSQNIQPPSGRDVVAGVLAPISQGAADAFKFEAQTPIEMGTEVLGGLIAEVPLNIYQTRQEAKVAKELADEALIASQKTSTQLGTAPREVPTIAEFQAPRGVENRLVRAPLATVDREAEKELAALAEQTKKYQAQETALATLIEDNRAAGRETSKEMQQLYEVAKLRRENTQLHYDMLKQPEKILIDDAKEFFKGTKLDGAPILEQTVSKQGVILPNSEIMELSQGADFNTADKAVSWTLDPMRAAELADNGNTDGIVSATMRNLSEAQGTAKLDADAEIQAFRELEQQLGINRLDKDRMKTLAAYAEKRLSPEEIAQARVTDSELQWINHTKSKYDEWLERINVERIKYGLEPIKKRKDYITHLANEYMVEAVQNTENPSLFGRMARGVGFQFGKPQSANIHASNIAESVEAYLPAAYRQIHMTGPLAELEARLPFMKPGMQKYFAGKLDIIKGGINPLDKAAQFVFGKNFMNNVAATTTLAVRSLLEGSINLVVQQPAQMMETLARTGLPSLVKGSMRAAGQEIPKRLQKYAPSIMQRDLLEDVAIKGNVFKNFQSFFKATLGKSDKYFAKQTWFSAFEHYKGQGYSEITSARLAENMTRMLHADYREMMKATMSQGIVGKALQPASTFAYNMFNHLIRDPKVLSQLNTTSKRAEFFKILGSIVATNYLWTKAGLPGPANFMPSIEGALDLSPGGLVETGKQVSRAFPPVASLQFGASPIALRATGLNPDDFDNSISLAMKAFFHEDDEKRAEARTELFKKPLGLIPGGRQIKNTLEGIEAVRDGYIKIGQEELPLNDWDKVLAPLIGPRSLHSSQTERRRQSVEDINKQFGVEE